MFNRRNAFIGWAVLQVVKRKLRKKGARAGGSGVARKLGRLGTGAALAGVVAVVAKKLRRRGDTGAP